MNNLDGMDYLKFEIAAFCLEGSKWIYAKTMPQCPHWYTLRKDYQFESIMPFDDLVLFMRQHSYPEQFYRKTMRRFAVNEMKYWTMGAPVQETILINRAVIEGSFSYYDNLSLNYDDMYMDPGSIQENRRVEGMINYKRGKVLDIGCGTGLFLDMQDCKNYHGIDPAAGMVAELKAKHGEGTTATCTKFEQWRSSEKYDLVVALFGAASYVDPEAWSRLDRIMEAGGEYFLMFYEPNYEPQYYQQIGRPSSLFDLDSSRFPDGRVIKLTNYEIITNIKGAEA